MTEALSGKTIALRIAQKFPQSVVESTTDAIVVAGDQITAIADFLKNTPDLSFDYLADLTSVDYLDYFEVVYRLVSLDRNHSLVCKVRCTDRQNPRVSSVTGVWKGASFMEREVFDLMGVTFTGHPDMRRIFLWDGFDGRPLRKDYH